MFVSTLHPSNINRLSDTVISGVLPRRTTQASGRSDLVFEASEDHHSSERQRSRPASTMIVVPRAPTRDLKNSSGSSNEAEAALARYQSNRRDIQRRYRKKMQDKELFLGESVKQLQADIRHIEWVRRNVVQRTVLVDTTPWGMIVELFRLFRHGYQPPSKLYIGTPGQCLDDNGKQKKFLETALAPDVAFNKGYGVAAVMEDWKSISRHHEDVQIELLRIDHASENTLVAYTNSYTTITANMINSAFSYLVRNDEAAKEHRLATKLLGQQLVIPTTVRFVWDESRASFTSVFYEGDMLTPLLELLGCMEDAITVLNSGLGAFMQVSNNGRDVWTTPSCGDAQLAEN